MSPAPQAFEEDARAERVIEANKKNPQLVKKVGTCTCWGPARRVIDTQCEPSFLDLNAIL